MTVIPDFKTDPFFNLKDQWITTAPNEITHYHEQGDGAPILLLHGSGIGTCASATWWLNIPSVAEVGRCIAFDFIGYGETQIAPITRTTETTNQIGLDMSPNPRFGIRAWGKHTLRLMDALDIEEAWLMGSSLGGWVALQLALDYPDRVLGIISVGTGGAQRDTRILNHSNPVNAYFTGLNPTKSHSENSLSASLKSAIPTPTPEYIYQDLQQKIYNDQLISNTLVTLRLQSVLKEQQRGLRAKLRQARDRDRIQLPLDMMALGQLSLPVLLIHGVNDKVVPMSHSLQLLQAIPSAEAHLLNNSGHWPHIGQADAFNSFVTNYLRRFL